MSNKAEKPCGSLHGNCLMESMLLNNGKYFLFGRHLKRLARSAAYFGVPVNTGEAIKLLRTYASKLNKQSYKVRLLVDAAGRMRI